MTKRCPKCGETKSVDAFSKDARRPDGTQAYCKDCANARARAWRAAHPGYLLQYQREHPDKIAGYNRRWRKAHPDKVKATSGKAAKIYRERHREKLREMNKRWRERNLERVKELHNRRRRVYRPPFDGKTRGEYREAVKKRRLARPEIYRTVDRACSARRRARLCECPVNDLTGRQWEEIQTLYGHRCVYCGKKAKELTMDHVVPLVKGGEHSFANVVPACRSCNSKKGVSLPPTFQPSLFFVPSTKNDDRLA